MLRTLLFHVADWPPMTAVDMYVFADTTAPGDILAGPYEAVTSGHGDGWVFVDIWDDQITIDDGAFYVGVASRASWDTYVSADRTPPCEDMSWWGETINGPWYPFSDFGSPVDTSDLSISAVVTYSDSSSTLLSGGRGTDLAQFGFTTEKEETKALVGYNIYRSQASGGPYQYINSVYSDQTTYEDSSVVEGWPYWYVVSATYHQKETEYSNEDSAASQSTAPLMPVDDLRSALEKSDIHLSWTSVTLDTADHAKTTDHYVVYRVTEPGAIIDDLDSIATTEESDYMDIGAAGDTSSQYFYIVRAVDAAGTKSAESNRVGEFDISLINE